jgi:hypothetical protein
LTLTAFGRSVKEKTRFVDLSPESLLSAYASGGFPMADPQTGEVLFYSCDPRCLIPLDERFRITATLARTVRGGALRDSLRHGVFSGDARVRRRSAPGRLDLDRRVDDSCLRAPPRTRLRALD